MDRETKTTDFAEIAALEIMLKVISPFDAESQDRMVCWLRSRLNYDNKKKASKPLQTS